MRDLSRSRTFYCDVLRFSEKFGRAEDGFCYLEMGHAQIMFEALPDDADRAWIVGYLLRFMQHIGTRRFLMNSYRLDVSGTDLAETDVRVWCRESPFSPAMVAFEGSKCCEMRGRSFRQTAPRRRINWRMSGMA